MEGDFKNLIMLIKLGVLDFESGVIVLVLLDNLFDISDLLNIESEFIPIGLFPLF